MTGPVERNRTRIQQKNTRAILDAALDVFSRHGFRGSTLDQIAAAAGLSKPNLLYYFNSKEDIHRDLLSGLLDTWLAPLRSLDADGDPISEICGYVQRKLEMSRDYPRESRLFANEIIQGATHIEPVLTGELKTLVDDKAVIIRGWITAGKIANLDPYHLIFSIWATTQHYADFEAQMDMVLGDTTTDPYPEAARYLNALFTKLLRPD